jgi:hypothetical protein
MEGVEQMTKLSDVINVPPKRRITIPEGYKALILRNVNVAELKSLMLLIRKGRRFTAEEKQVLPKIAGDILLAIMEAEDGQ